MYKRHGKLRVYRELSICSFSSLNIVTADFHHEAQTEEEGEHDIHKIFEGNGHEPIPPDTSWKAYKDMQRGRLPSNNFAEQRLHASVAVVANSLLNLSATNGKAQAMSYEPPMLDVESWNVLIASHVEDGHIDKAIACIYRMQCHGLFPNTGTLASILKLCASMGAIDKGQLVHAHLDKNGVLEKDIVVGTVLVDMYSRCGSLAKAREVFHKLPFQDIVSWNVLIAGHIQHGLCKEALECIEEMQNKGLNPNSVTFAYILKSCGIIGAAIRGHEVHDQIVRQNMSGKSILVSNALADMYAKFGLLESAQSVFQDLATRDVVSWNMLITAYTQYEQCDEAIKCFERMQCESLLPSLVTFACILKASGSSGALSKGQQVHAQSSRQVFVEKGQVLANAVLDMYVKCGALVEAQAVFDKLRARDVASWTLIVGGYAQDGCGEEAMMYFERMQCESSCPNVFTFVAVLMACGSTRASEKSNRVHCQASGECLLEKCTVVSNALIDAYMKCGAFAKAQEVFNKLSVCDSISWNVLISGYAQHGHGEQALNYYKLMQNAGFSPDVFTYACICKACGSLCAAYASQQVHAKIVSCGLLERDIVIANSLVDMFCRCGMLSEARAVFNGLPVQDVVSWNSLIAGYIKHELFDEALKCFEQMWDIGLTPDVFTLASIIKACGSLGAPCKGQGIHAGIARNGPLETDMVLGTALIGMYATFGMLNEAQEVFDELPGWDMASLNALLAGYSQSGEDKLVINTLMKLIEEGYKPDFLTSSIVLNACIHTGLLDEGQMYFEIMSTTIGTIFTMEHYTCLIDLFGRSGHLHKAVLIIKDMPFHANFTVWITLLGACQSCRNVVIGRWAFKHAAQLGEEDAAAHVLMSNIYAAVGMHEVIKGVGAIDEVVS